MYTDTQTTNIQGPKYILLPLCGEGNNDNNDDNNNNIYNDNYNDNNSRIYNNDNDKDDNNDDDSDDSDDNDDEENGVDLCLKDQWSHNWGNILKFYKRQKQKWKFKMAFAIKGGRSRVPLTYFEKWFF